jgi:FkbM family methyltransferase
LGKADPAHADRSVVTLNDGRFEYSFVCHSEKERNRAKRMFEKEKGTIAWLDRELRPGDVYFDVGANIGVYTLFGARRVGEKGSVVAFEPHIPNANSLLENIILNGLGHQIKLVTAALSDRECYDHFNYQAVTVASSTSQFGRTSYEGEAFDPIFVEVKHSVRIDTLIGTGAVSRPNVVKIDVDGLDFEVLDGMRRLISSAERPRSIQIELGSDSKPRILSLLEETGYVLREKHWTAAGLEFIAEGNDPERYPHYGIFNAPDHS